MKKNKICNIHQSKAQTCINKLVEISKIFLPIKFFSKYFLQLLFLIFCHHVHLFSFEVHLLAGLRNWGSKLAKFIHRTENLFCLYLGKLSQKVSVRGFLQESVERKDVKRKGK